MNPADAPEWLLGLVAAVAQYEDEHASEAFCLGQSLADVPMDMQIAANTYRRFKPTPQEPDHE